MKASAKRDTKLAKVISERCHEMRKGGLRFTRLPRPLRPFPSAVGAGFWYGSWCSSSISSAWQCSLP